jgi:hypothetical protein
MANVAELVVKIIADTKDAQKGVDDVATKSSKMGDVLGKAALPAAAALTAVAGAAIAAGKAAAEDEQAQAVLATTLKNTAGATDAQIKAVEDHIAAMSLATGVADDELRPAMGNLMRATGDVTKSQEAMAIALDVAAATGTSVESVTKAMSKGYGGSATSLKKLVPSLDDATVKSGDMNKIMEELAETTGGSAAAAADTAAGKMDIFQNAMGEAQEEAGSALIPIMTTLAEILVDVAKWIGENTTLFLVIAGVIAGVAAAILIANAAIAIYNTVTAIAGIVSAAAWGAALLPILLVIAAIVAVTVVLVILWKKSETFRNIVLGVWGAIKDGVIALKNKAVEVWNAIGDKAQNTVADIKGFFVGLKDRITELVETAKENAVNKFVAIRDKASAVVADIKEFFVGLKDRISELANTAKENMNEKLTAIKTRASEIVGDIKQFFVDMWANIKDRIPEDIAAKLAAPFTAGKDAVNAMKDAVGFLIGKVESLIGWLKNIKVPSLPGWVTGKTAPSAAAAVPTVGRYAAPSGPSTSARASSSSRSTTIIVNGAIDPEATARQIRRILAGHDRRVGLA